VLAAPKLCCEQNKPFCKVIAVDAQLLGVPRKYQESTLLLAELLLLDELLVEATLELLEELVLAVQLVTVVTVIALVVILKSILYA
jgi:hypothetical protein